MKPKRMRHGPTYATSDLLPLGQCELEKKEAPIYLRHALLKNLIPE